MLKNDDLFNSKLKMRDKSGKLSGKIGIFNMLIFYLHIHPLLMTLLKI